MVELIEGYVEVLSKIRNQLVNVLLTCFSELRALSKHSENTLCLVNWIEHFSMLLQVSCISDRQLVLGEQLLLKWVQRARHQSGKLHLRRNPFL